MELYFDKISKYDRAREPVTVSIPFAEMEEDVRSSRAIRR